MSDRDKLVGTWRLIEIEDLGPIKEFQECDPFGYIMYDSSGHMAVQIVRCSDRPKFASGKHSHGTLEETKAAFLGYGAYFGTYEVNEKEGKVIHHLEGALFPNDIGRDNTRYYELSGDRLIMKVTNLVNGKPIPKSSSLRTLIWERVK